MSFNKFMKNYFKGLLVAFCVLISIIIIGLPIILSIILGTFINPNFVHLIWFEIFFLPLGSYGLYLSLFILTEKLWNFS